MSADADAESPSVDARPTRSVINTLKPNKAAALRLPAPSEPRPQAALYERLSTSEFYQFRSAGILEKRGRDDEDRRLWGVPPRVDRWIRENVDTETTPCGNATGVRCVEAGETYTCTDDECDCRFGRETAAEVVGR